ncbi:hypothetical protein [Dietzia cercidiphylli]|uniref:hypothetical protein n=1 Tax=Dietzia cercidiphylli TaxID=498199 RepID=UPI0035CD0ADE
MGVAALTLVGHADDRTELSAGCRLGAQILVGALNGDKQGVSVANSLRGALVVPSLVNSFNFMDGINGISAGQVVVWSVSAIPLLRAANLKGLVTLNSVALGSSLAFLPWNIPGARVFLGDVGSYLYGSTIAITWLSATSSDRRIAFRLLSPYFCYLADTGSTLVRRTFEGQNLMEAHRSHAYQRLADQVGVQHWHVACGVSLISALSSVFSRAKHGGVLTSLLVAGYLVSPRVIQAYGANAQASLV